MSNATKIFGYFVGLAIVGFVVWLLWVFVVNINAADPSVKAGLIGLLGVFSAALVTNYQTKKREISARHFGEKRESYLHIIDLIFDITKATKTNLSLPDDELVQKVMLFKKALIVWGNSDIIEAWNNFEIISEDDVTPEKMLQEMEKILKLIRKDLGHDDSNMKFGSLWGLMLIAKDKKMLLKEQ